MRALSITRPGSLVLIETDPPTANGTEALVAPRYVGLCGTDLELFSGSMPYLADGTASYPIQPGHEVTGIVVTSPDDRAPPGTAVLIDPVVGCGSCEACACGLPTRCSDRRELGLRRGMPGGACELIAVPVHNLHPIPAGVSLRDAVLVEPGVTALNAVIRLGDVRETHTLVIGAGTVGLIAAQLLVSRGASVDVVVIESARAALIERLGAQPVRRAVAARYPLVMEAAGTADAVRTALTAVAPGGTLAVAGVQPGPVDQVDVNEIVLKDVTVHGVLNGPGLYPSMLNELANGSVNASALIEAEFEFADAAAAVSAMEAPNRAAPKVMLSINAAVQVH